MEYGLSNHLHKPALLVLFEVQEWGLIGIFYTFSLLSGGWWWLMFLVGPAVSITYFRKQERGNLEHLQVAAGLKEIKGYPPFTATEFEE